MKYILILAIALLFSSLAFGQYPVKFDFPKKNEVEKNTSPHLRSVSYSAQLNYYELYQVLTGYMTSNYAFQLNSRIIVEPLYPNLNLSSIGFILDTILNTDYESFPNYSYTIDTLKMPLLHANHSGLNDTIIVRIVDVNETTHFPNGLVLWVDTLFTNTSLSTGPAWNYMSDFTKFIPNLHVNGDVFIDVHYFGPAIDTFGVVVASAECTPSAPTSGAHDNFNLGKIFRQHYPNTSHYLPDITGYDSAWVDNNANLVFDAGDWTCESSLWTVMHAPVHVTTENSTVQGKVYNDMNGNSVFDAGDYGIADQLVSTSGWYSITNANGDYNLMTDTGTIVPALTMPTFFSATENPGTIVHTYYGQVTSGANFGIAASGTNNNLTVHGTPYAPPIPGMSRYTALTVQNNGNTSLSPVVKYVPSATMEFISSIPTPTGFSGDTIYWNLSALLPFNNYTIEVLDSTPVGTTLGDTLHFAVFAEPLVGDAFPGDNETYFDDIVIGSYDPNDKTPSPLGTGAQGNIPQDLQSLDYRIRFQNTGSYYAFNITIIDTIDANLDLSSLDILSASHAYEVEIYEGGIVKFHFYNIMLPDSNMNEPLSHGFIRYKINLLPMLPFGTEIKNTGYIYFDFNEAIITNTTLNTIDSPTGVNNVETTRLTCFPNPSNNVFNLKCGHVPAKSVSIFTIDGKPVNAAIEFNKTSALVKMVDKETGIYFIETAFEDGSKQRIKVVLQR